MKLRILSLIPHLVFFASINLIEQKCFADIQMTLIGGGVYESNELFSKSAIQHYTGVAGVGVSSTPTSNWFFSFEYSYQAGQDRNSTGLAGDLSITHPFFGVRYFITKKRIFSIGAYYALQSQAKFKTSSGIAETWSGTSTLIRLGITPAFGKRSYWHFGFDYIQSNFDSKSTTGAGSSSLNTFTRSSIYPSIGTYFSF